MMQTRGDWYRAEDGVWRNPRYPAGQANAKNGPVNLEYDPETNEAVLSIGEISVSLTFYEIKRLLDQGWDANRQAQEENSRLWKEKEAIMVEEDGYVPPIYERGRRVN